LEVERTSVELALPVLHGPSPSSAPVFRSPRHEESSGDDEVAQPPVVRTIAHTGDETRIVTSYGYRYDGPYGARIEEHYDGLVGVAPREPGRAWAEGRARYAIAWPEASVRTESRLRLDSTPTAYRVVVDVVADEVGGELGRIERRYERTIPRRLQ
ncbi:MAG TPA: hypothetical protein VFU99_04060, partial [Gaiellaceae bacterium]|nr:hypothetical protein [Gaiellaceae bacterium]